MVKPGLAGSSKGGGPAGLLEMPSCLQVLVPFTTGVASFRELGKSRMWVSHSCNHHSMVPSAQSWHYWYFQHSFPNTPTTLWESPLNKHNFCSRVWPSIPHVGNLWTLSPLCLPESLDVGSRVRMSDACCRPHILHAKTHQLLLGSPGNVLLPPHWMSEEGKKNLVPVKVTLKCAGRKSESNTTSNEPIIRGFWQSEGNWMLMKSRFWE